MITEDYVSFETAKILKENGFYGDIDLWYDENGEMFFLHNYDISSDWRVKAQQEVYQCPTLQMAMKWLRQKYNLHIITLPYAPMDRYAYHPGEADMVYIAQLFRGIIPIDEIGRSVIKLTPEEACDAAIKYCLENLI